MLRRVASIITDVSEELSTSILRATEIRELKTTLGVTSNRRTQRLITYQKLIVPYMTTKYRSIKRVQNLRIFLPRSGIWELILILYNKDYLKIIRGALYSKCECIASPPSLANFIGVKCQIQNFDTFTYMYLTFSTIPTPMSMTTPLISPHCFKFHTFLKIWTNRQWLRISIRCTLYLQG
jgi:hypothetical protein